MIFVEERKEENFAQLSHTVTYCQGNEQKINN
jgi:hypothetical protein